MTNVVWNFVLMPLVYFKGPPGIQKTFWKLNTRPQLVCLHVLNLPVAAVQVRWLVTVGARATLG